MGYDRDERHRFTIPKRPVRKRRVPTIGDIVIKVADKALAMLAIGIIIYCGIEFIMVAINVL
jgi:hypothetical protein